MPRSGPCSDGGNGKPRPHHYEFAHRSFPELPLTRGSISRCSAARDVSWLSAPYVAPVGERHRGPDRLRGELVEIVGEPTVLVTFPAASHAAEALFVAIAPLEPSESRRYLTLEFSWNVVTDRSATIAGE